MKWVYDKTTRKHIANVFVKTRVLLPNAVAWYYIYPEKNLRTLSWTIRMEPKNGMIPIKSGL